MMGRWVGVLALALGLLGGCSGKNTVTEGDRQLSHQNVGAAQEIKSKTADPAIIQPADDIQKNSTQQLENWGPPEQPKVYGAGASQQSRDQAKKEHETPWWQMALGSLGSILVGVLGSGMLTRILPTVFGGPVGGAAVAVIEGITRLRQQVKDAPGGTLSLNEETLLKVLSEAQKDDRVKALIQGIAHKIESKLALRL